jgi:arylsulfatase A-like enzyme
MAEPVDPFSNIIFIMADDLGYGDLGCYGAAKIPSPHIDRIATQGMRFSDAHASSAVCSPSRYSVLTGRYCWRSPLKQGVLWGFSPPLIETDRLTVAGLLKKQGYTAASIGNWHLGFNWTTIDGSIPQPKEEGRNIDYSTPLSGGPNSLGFDYSFNISGSLDMPPYCFIENSRVVDLPAMEKEPYNPQQRPGLMTPGWRDEDVDVTFAQKAISWIEEQAQTGNPFFLYLTPSAPHRPCMPPGSYNDQLICLGDLLATCADITHVELPEDAGPDSRSILPVLLGEEHLVRETLVHHSADGMFSIRQGSWKLIEGLGSGGFSEPTRLKPEPEGPTDQLYNVAQDIGEQNNLWQEKPQLVAEMQALLEEVSAASASDPPLS